MIEADCALARRLIDSFYDGSLGPSEWDALVHHMRRCTECGRHFRETSDVFRALRPETGDDRLSPLESERLLSLIEKRTGLERPLGKGPETRRRLLYAAAGLAAAAGFIVFLRAGADRLTEGREQRLHEKGAGVSADLFCVVEPDRTVPLTGSQASCPEGAQVVARAAAALGNRLPYLTIVACDDGFSCRVASRSRFDGNPEVVAPGPRMKPGERLRIFAVWSDKEIADEVLDQAAHRAQTEQKSTLDTSTLQWVSSWPQMAFSVRSLPDASSP
jgi:hypothetical protein